MSERDDKIESVDEAILEDETLKKPRRRYGKIALGFTALTALIIGGASGGGFVQYVMPHFVSAEDTETPAEPVNLAPLETQLSQLAAQNKASADKNTRFEARLSALEAAIKRLDIPKAASAQAPVIDKAVISDLEARLSQLENAPKPTAIDADLLTRLESLQEEGSPALDLSAIETRLAALENSNDNTDISAEIDDNFTNIYEKQADSEIKFDGQIAALTANIQALKTQLDATQTQLSDIRSEQIETPLSDTLSFPRQALMDAIAAQRANKPLLQRALGKHIKVKDPSDPSVIVNAIETDLAKGDIDTAITRFDNLPPDIRNIASEWRASVNPAQ